jgi:hypothetical protein
VTTSKNIGTLRVVNGARLKITSCSTSFGHTIAAPMGGVRDSGWGRTGPDSLKEFQDVIWINSHSGQRQYPI